MTLSSALSVSPSSPRRTKRSKHRPTDGPTPDAIAEILNDLAGYHTVLIVADMARIFRISPGRVRADAPTGSHRIPPGWRQGGGWRWLKIDVARFLAELRLKALKEQQRRTRGSR